MDFLNNMGPSGQWITMILVYGVIFGGMYLLIMRPQQKRRKQEEELRNNLKLGDEITTIGGIVGHIINIKENDDSLVIESGSDKIRIKRWAIASIDNKSADNK